MSNENIPTTLAHEAARREVGTIEAQISAFVRAGWSIEDIVLVMDCSGHRPVHWVCPRWVFDAAVSAGRVEVQSCVAMAATTIQSVHILDTAFNDYLRGKTDGQSNGQ